MVDPTEAYNSIETRDFAAGHLAGLLGFRVKRNDENTVQVDGKMGALSRLLLREAVREVAKRELARWEK